VELYILILSLSILNTPQSIAYILTWLQTYE
jgi:hypothetical protein